MTTPLISTISAPFLGIAFGWFLERGGLGSAPKLAGQFYLTDFAVFRVMFSALITALLGAFWLDRLGILDLNAVYLPETFLIPQAIGGLLFGIGFVTTGLCPGTCCVATASGKLDGLCTMSGILVGIVVFNTAYPLIESFCNSTALGVVTFPSLFGFPRGFSVSLVTMAALIGFFLSQRLERKE
jgi:uncharacterized protein